MWENDGRKKLIINIVLCVVIVAVLAGLLFFMLRVREETKRHDEQLAQMYTQQQQQQNEARQESVNSIDVEYQKQMDTVASYMPGIVCWGDNTTAAVSGMLNFPYVLQTYINTYLCDIYDFSSTIENALDYTRLDWKKYKVSIPVVNMASGKESSYTILGRAGVVPYVTAEEFTIPAGTEPVDIRFVSKDEHHVTPLTGGDVGFNNVTIAGVEGVIALNNEAYNYNGYANYTFTRLQPGNQRLVEAGTPINVASANMYKNYIHVVMIGTYGEFTSADDLVRQVKELLARQTQNSERFIVLGPYANATYSYAASLSDIDNAMVQAFGNRYISIRKYLIGDGYTDAGISPTNDDKYYIAQETVPPSFKVASQSEELNSLAHKLIGKLVYMRMDNLGYFDEIKDALNLTETTKEIIKDRPQYFESIINNILN